MSSQDRSMNPLSFQERLGQALVEAGFLTAEMLTGAEKTAQKENKRLANVLIDQRLISREVLITALSFQFRIPTINLKMLEIKPEALKLVPKEFAQQHEVMPVAIRSDGDLLVAMENPNDFESIKTLSAMTRRTIRPVLPLDISVSEMLELFYTPTAPELPG